MAQFVILILTVFSDANVVSLTQNMTEGFVQQGFVFHRNHYSFPEIPSKSLSLPSRIL
ncbi:unnamed protein product [Brugia timori]|uniref:Secreted protein n=1 Tax=Brugia timori TaxID=42155 RepID=A0A0R3Q7J3_9BILA|nr:unnamed protein product [Brugia timori]